ncbi:hypothetical protein PanWU01x14_299690 [Parasponia andersonii]|uniref:Uncharacterized protein n=1 Tax=Parasponia andersonii TaxID=3476 RepID=A0A2P5AU95_PARAD|nr:hypothetical protein PanWU01x14_299690 [Parasponia andersonii]
MSRRLPSILLTRQTTQAKCSFVADLVDGHDSASVCVFISVGRPKSAGERGNDRCITGLFNSLINTRAAVLIVVVPNSDSFDLVDGHDSASVCVFISVGRPKSAGERGNDRWYKGKDISVIAEYIIIELVLDFNKHNYYGT